MEEEHLSSRQCESVRRKKCELREQEHLISRQSESVRRKKCGLRERNM